MLARSVVSRVGREHFARLGELRRAKAYAPAKAECEQLDRRFHVLRKIQKQRPGKF